MRDMVSPQHAARSTQHFLIRVWRDDAEHVLRVPEGANLRRVLLGAGLSPYAALTRRANCGGRGLCAGALWAGCGARLIGDAPPPAHRHDALAARFGYPRLSSQIAATGDLTVRLVAEKWVWGNRERTGRHDE